jgi:hypothetical protein
MRRAGVIWLLPLLVLSADGAGRGCTEATMERELQRFRAVGFGTSAEEWATVGQNQLLAIRTAKLDAYRTMAEQVYGFRLSGSTTVSSMMVKSDRFRIYVDAVIRGAEVVSVQPIGNEVYEVVLEMTLALPVPQLPQCGEPMMPEGRAEPEPSGDRVRWLSDLFGRFTG